MLKITNDTWFFSDPHFFHDNIIKYCGRPQNHDELMILNLNTLVQPDDDIVYLGDIFLAKGNKYMSGKERFLDILPLLRGNKYLILGNHNKRKFLEECGFTIIAGRHNKFYKWDKDKIYIYFSHRPLIDEVYLNHKQGIFNVHGHIHEKKDISPAHINISVEQTMYRPIKFEEILNKIERRMNKCSYQE